MIPEPVYRQHPKVVAAPISDSETVLLSLVTSRYYSLNESGVQIWNTLQGGASLSRVVEALTEVYEATWEEAEALVAEFFEVLREEELIQLEASDAQSTARGMPYTVSA